MGMDGELTIETTAHTYRPKLQVISRTIGIAIKNLTDRCLSMYGAIEYKVLMHYRDCTHESSRIDLHHGHILYLRTCKGFTHGQGRTQIMVNGNMMQVQGMCRNCLRSLCQPVLS